VNTPERVASVIAGGLLAAAGFKARSRSGGAMVLAGTGLLCHGITGRSYIYQLLGIRTAPPGQGKHISVPYELGARAEAAVTINKPRAELYALWREFSNLPRFMRHLRAVQVIGRKSHWVAEGPGRRPVEWDAEVVQEIPNELIGWRSLPGSEIQTAGSVRFRDAPGRRGCEVQVELQYNPPAGAVGALFAKLFGRDPATEIREDLDRLKEHLEAGEAPTTEGQPQGSVMAITAKRETGRELSASVAPREVPA